MEFVGSRLGDHTDLGPGRASLIGIGESGSHTEFFHRVLGFTQHAGKGVAVDLIVVVQAVQGDIALVGPSSVDGAAAGIVLQRWIAGPAGILAKIEHPRLQGEQIGNVAALAGQCLDEGIVHGLTQRGIGGVECLRLPRLR